MPKKNVAKIDVVKAIAGVSFATLAAVGGSTGNPTIAGLSALPSAGLASYEAISDQLHLIKSRNQKEKYLEIPLPPWWTHDTPSWQNLCAEIGQHLPRMLDDMLVRMQCEQEALTREVVQCIFIDVTIEQDFTWAYDHDEKRLIGEFISSPILQKLDQILQPVIEQLQQEGTLIDSRKTAQHTEQAVHVLEKIHTEIIKVSHPYLPDKDEVATTYNQYCDVLYRRWRVLDFKGIMHIDMNRPISIPLAEVFIFPDVLIGVPEHETLEREGEHFLYGNHPQRKIKRITPQREPLHTVLAKHHRLVLLGDPGSGKSTLLRYLLLQLTQGRDVFTTTFPQMTDIAEIVPLYMPLSTYAEALLSNAPGTRSLEDFIPVYLQDNYLGAYIDFIQSQLEQGNLFLLFDGLDEIPDTSLRMNVVRHIEMFTQAYAANRFIVTSRIVGYKAAPLSNEYQPYTLADFEKEQVKRFTQKWCPAYEYWVQGTRDGQHLEDAATKEADRLFAATQSKPGVRRLAVNPLLLTILALIQRQGIELPSHRVELFELCAFTLIDTWVKARGQSINFSKNDIIKILRPLAFWMHEHQAVGAIPEEELHEQIVRQLVGRTINEYEAAKIAEQFLQTVRGKTGILVERGKERYGFLHLTFEEYFAAKELEKRKDKYAFIRAHLHDPRWREVILLMVGSVGILQSNEEEVTELVYDVIANAESPYEQVLHRDLLFAGLCLADDVGVTVACENDIIEKIVLLYTTVPYDTLRDTVSNVLHEWSGTRIAQKAASLVLPLLQWRLSSHDSATWTFTMNSSFEREQADHTEKLAASYQVAMMKALQFRVSLMLANLQSLSTISWIENIAGIASEENVRERMTVLLEQYADKREGIIEALLVALSDPDQQVRWNAVLGLGLLDAASPHVADRLMIMLADPYYSVREAAADILAQFNDTRTYVVDSLLDILSNKSGGRDALVQALGRLGKGQDRVLDTLLASLFDVDDWTVRQAAAIALRQFGKGQSRIINELIIALSDSVEDVREAVADTLEQLYEGNKYDFADTLLTVISDLDAHAIELTINALSQLSDNSIYIKSRLILLLTDADIAREAAANALGLFSAKHSAVTEKLVNVISGLLPWKFKREAVRALRRLHEKSPSVAKTILNAFHASSSWEFRREAIRTIGKLSEGEPLVIDTLLAAITDSSNSVKREAARALAQLSKRQPQILKALLTMASDSDAWWSTRREAIRALGILNDGEPEVIDGLLAALIDHDDDVQKEAIQALSHLLKTQPEAVRYISIALSRSDIIAPPTYAYKDRLFAAYIERALSFLKGISIDDPFIVDTLFSLLPDSTPMVRREAATTLGQLGKKDASIIDRLLALLSDSSKYVREAAARALEQFGEGQSQIMDALLLALHDSETIVRRAVVSALRQCGKGNSQVPEALLHALSDDDDYVRGEVVFAIGSLSKLQPSVIETLIQALSDPNAGFVRSRAIRAILILKDEQSQLTEALLQPLFGDSVLARDLAASAIGSRWNGETHIVETLLAHLTSSDITDKVSALKAFRNIIDKSEATTEILLSHLSNSSWLIREAATEALYNHNSNQSTVTDSLLLTLSDPFSAVRAEAVRSLHIEDKSNISVIKALLQATFDSDWYVRETAASALSTSQEQVKMIGDRLEQLLQQYEWIAHRDLRWYNPIIDALQEIAKKI